MELTDINSDKIVVSAYTDLHNCINQIKLNVFSYLEYKELEIIIPPFEESNIDNDVEILFLEYLGSSEDKLNFDNEDAASFISEKISRLQNHFNKLITLTTFFDIVESKRNSINSLAQDVEAVKMLLEEKRFNTNYNLLFAKKSFIKRERKNDNESKILSSNAIAKFFIALERMQLINSKFYTEKAKAINILTGFGTDNMEDNLANFIIKKDDIIKLENFTRSLLNEFKNFDVTD